MMIPCVTSRECDAVRGMASLGRLGRSALGRARRGRGQQLTAIDTVGVKNGVKCVQ